MSRLRAVAAQLRIAASEFEADRWSGDDCVAIAEELSATVKACAAAAARAVACQRGSVEWLARTSGTTPAEARAMLSTVELAAECPATSAALAAGEVSLAQAREIVAAEAAVAGSEAALLGVAASTGMAGLREEARWVRLAVMDRDALHAERQRVRSVQHWIDGLGMVEGRFRLPPEVGVLLVNRLDAETDRLRRVASSGTTTTRSPAAA